MQLLKGHKERVWQLAWHPSGKILASCSSDKTICIYKDINDGNYQLSEILDQGHSKTIRCLAFSPNGMYLASGSFDSIVIIWRIDEGKFKLIQKLEGHDSEIKSVNWSFDSRYLASCSRDKTIWIWEHEDLEFQCMCILQVHTQDVKYVKWYPNSYTLFSCSYDNTIIEYQFIDEDWQDEQDKQILCHNDTIWCIDIYQDLMCSVSSDLNVRIFRRINDKWNLIQTFIELHTEPIYSCSFNYNGNLIAVGSGDNRVSIFRRNGEDEFNNPKYELDEQFEGNQFDVNCVAFHPKDNILAICGDEEIIHIKQIQQQQ